MCGIAGLLCPPNSNAVDRSVRAMLDQIGHRGPDGSGVHVDREVGLGHVRLSILDLSEAAAQPMASHDDRFVLTYNGEVFNFRALRERLEQRGMVFRSTGDTEVLLELLAAFGPDDVLPQIEGFFAFGLWDRKERSLLLARDRYGIKPLYYRQYPDGTIRFASEMRPLLDADTPPEPAGVTGALLGHGLVAGAETVFRGVQSLLPGQWIRFAPGGARTSRRFFDVADYVDPQLHRELAQASTAEVTARLDRALEESIDYRLVSDAPVACLVSGGIDSSLITTLAARRSNQLGLFHADVEHNSERPWAEALAKAVKLPLDVVSMTNQDFLDHVPITTRHAEIPLIYHANSVPFLLVSKRVGQQRFKVVLTGEGSDEFFLGYPMLAIRRYLRWASGLGSAVQRGFHALFPRGGKLLWPQQGAGAPAQLMQLVDRFAQQRDQAEFLQRTEHIRSARDRELTVESLHLLRGHLTTLLHRNDRLGMAASIESRFPFLGRTLARLAVNLPARYKIRVVPRFYNVRHPFHMDKWAVRWLAGQHLDKALVHRPKKGFPIALSNRVAIGADLFAGGWVADWFGLPDAAVTALPQRVDKGFLFALMLLEVWGRVMCRHEAPDAVRETLRRHVRLV
ncbi:MAG: asparagine synthase (glutamine-hydrolyzing) [Planctomycetes bacterium]|nr:asparagine synthase (glutamine-hydrolyzing) [Planctomycetota bacterium]